MSSAGRFSFSTRFSSFRYRFPNVRKPSIFTVYVQECVSTFFAGTTPDKFPFSSYRPLGVSFLSDNVPATLRTKTLCRQFPGLETQKNIKYCFLRKTLVSLFRSVNVGSSLFPILRYCFARPGRRFRLLVFNNNRRRIQRRVNTKTNVLLPGYDFHMWTRRVSSGTATFNPITH